MHAGLSLTREQAEAFKKFKEQYKLESDSAVLKVGLALMYEAKPEDIIRLTTREPNHE